MTGIGSREAGFTLLELLVAIALTALAVGSLPAIFEFARRSTAAVARVDKRAGDWAALAFIEQRLNEITAAELQDKAGVKKLAFNGQPDRIGFVAPLTFLADDSGLAEFEIAFSGQPSEGVMMAWRMWRPAPPGGRKPELPPVRSRSLVPGAQGLAFRYWGSPKIGEPASWTNSWPRSDALPDVIELSIDTRGRIEKRSAIVRLRPPDRR